MPDDDRATAIALAEYKEVVTQFRTLTDIRFKLLTYLPLSTVAASVFVQASSPLAGPREGPSGAERLKRGTAFPATSPSYLQNSRQHRSRCRLESVLVMEAPKIAVATTRWPS